MKKQILLTSLFTCAALAASAQLVIQNQWEFNDTAGTDLGSAVDSVGSAQFNTGLGGGGTWDTNGSGQLTGLGRFGQASISGPTTGIYQLDLKGVTLSSFSGGTDDVVAFGLRSFASNNNVAAFGGATSSADQATIVFGNENDSGGLDIQVYDNGADLGLQTDVYNFSSTFDFRILRDLDNDTADYLIQVDGGGYTPIVSQQFNSAAVNLLAIGSNGFGATVGVDEVTWTAVPEPSTYAIILGVMALGVVWYRRRRS